MGCAFGAIALLVAVLFSSPPWKDDKHETKDKQAQVENADGRLQR